MVQKNDLQRLRDFCNAARGGSQEKIIIEFLEMIIRGQDEIDSGSILISDGRKKELVLFNGDELLRRNILTPASKNLWPSTFSWYEGAAGKALRTRRIVRYRKADGEPADFTGTSPIENMICIPIDTGGKEPFGVVCLHNNVAAKVISEERTDLFEVYVEALALALHTPHPELHIEKNIFIVHGRDEQCRNQLQLLIFKYGANPKVLQEENKGPKAILNALEELIQTCKAGFILLTPDDEGRLFDSGAAMTRRARENVIFETGLLFARFRAFDRVCLLLKRPVQLPSDLNGINYEPFDTIESIEGRIAAKLKEWGVSH